MRNSAFLILSIIFTFGFFAPKALIADDAAATQPGDDVVTGEFQTTFTSRSPLSAPVELAKRFGIKPPEQFDDYDLSSIKWNVFVPNGYDAASPPGMIVTFGYPQPMSAALKTFCNSSYFMFLSTTPTPSNPTRQAGLLLDAVTNIARQYSLDRTRIYFLDVYDEDYVAYSVQDVYTGFIIINKLFYPGRLPLHFKGEIWDFPSPSPHPMQDTLMKLARKRAYAYVLTTEIDPSDPILLEPDAMQANGFSHVKKIRAARDGVFYPNIDITWFADAVKFLDTAPATDKPAATQPAPGQAVAPSEKPASAQSLLNLANTFISNGQTDLAKQKLNELIDRYPTDPLADQARKLLDQLNNP